MIPKKMKPSGRVPKFYSPLCGLQSAFTLFELLAVLTTIGVILAVILGSYSSWGTAHALTGAARTVEAGLAHARALAVSQHACVVFHYGTTNAVRSSLSRTTGFQPFLCANTNINGTAVSEADLQPLANYTPSPTDTFIPPDGAVSTGGLILDPAAPFQRLSGHVRLSRRESEADEHALALLVFRPDGSIIIKDNSPSSYPYPLIALSASDGSRLLRIDPTTGLVTHWFRIAPTTGDIKEVSP